MNGETSGTEDSTAPPVDVARDWLTRATRIIMLAMACVMASLGVALVVTVLNERSTQRNADANAESLRIVTQQLADVTAQNTQLDAQLTCLRLPTFEADKAQALLAITTARGLAAVGLDDGATLNQLSRNLLDDADTLEETFDIRELAIDECAKDPDWVPPPTTP